ncbi:uncharacterized protein LOC134839282 [Symsagittifera roscoffensis]|uniref:uncharacterized protein LOC134839282 n=1 Tax=Symsagittifera roscoffensis TaxID=84072 RepID=UPI00307B16F1
MENDSLQEQFSDRKLAEVLIELETARIPGSEEDSKPQKVNAKRGFTSGQMWLRRSSWCPHPQAVLNEDVTERVRLSPGKDENLGNLYVIHKLSLPHREESEEDMSKSNESSKMIEPGSCLNLAVVSVGVESILVTGCLARNFCLMRFWLGVRQSSRIGQSDDGHQFEQLIRPYYSELNWYSYREDEEDGCCSYQVTTYLQYGQRFGLSPEEYFNKVYNMGVVEDKQLVYLKARWNQFFCMNIIEQVGFGRGVLRIVGVNGQRARSKFMMPPLGEADGFFKFPAEHLQSRLTFEWFLYNVICEEKSWLCVNGRNGTANRAGGLTPGQLNRRRMLTFTKVNSNVTKNLFN